MNYDKHTRRSTLVYKKGVKVVIKCKNEKVWTKAIIIEKANEPRSYWVKKEGSNIIIRRNTSQIKPSVTGSDRQVINEPELYPAASKAVDPISTNTEKHQIELREGYEVDQLLSLITPVAYVTSTSANPSPSPRRKKFHGDPTAARAEKQKKLLHIGLSPKPTRWGH
nr:unnamed protein product [Callosobruchus chinensis]